MSLSVAAPSLQKIHRSPALIRGRPSVPLESRIIRHKLVEVGHELVDRLPHVHMPYVSPYRVRI